MIESRQRAAWKDFKLSFGGVTRGRVMLGVNYRRISNLRWLQGILMLSFGLSQSEQKLIVSIQHPLPTVSRLIGLKSVY